MAGSSTYCVILRVKQVTMPVLYVMFSHRIMVAGCRCQTNTALHTALHTDIFDRVTSHLCGAEPPVLCRQQNGGR